MPGAGDADVAAPRQPDAQLRHEAGDPQTAAERLRELGAHYAEAVRALVAGNPNTPRETLLALADAFPAQFLANPALPLLLLEAPEFAAQLPDVALPGLLRCENCPRWILAHAQAYVRQEEGRTAPSGGATSEKRLAQAVRVALAAHVSLSGEVDEANEAWEEDVMRQIFVEFPMPSLPPELFERAEVTPAWALEMLASHPNVFVRKLAARSPETPDQLIERLALDGSRLVRLYVAGRGPDMIGGYFDATPPLPRHVLEMLAKDGDEDIRLLIAIKDAIPQDLFERLSRDADAKVRAAVASNKATPSEIRERLSADPDAVVCAAALIQAPSTPERLKMLIELARNPNPVARQRVALNPHLPVIVFEELARDPDEDVRRMVACNPAAPAAMLERLASDEREWVRGMVGLNRETPENLRERLASDAHMQVRQFVAMGRATPAPLLERLVRDPELMVRKSVASNPNTPLALLEMLAQDRDSSILSGIVANRQAPRQLRAFALGRCLDATVESNGPFDQFKRFLALASPYTSQATLARYATPTQSWLFGYAIARNPSADAATLGTLAHDGNRYVRAAARATLAACVPSLP